MESKRRVLKTRQDQVREFKKLNLPLTRELQFQLEYDSKDSKNKDKTQIVSLVHGRAVVDIDYFGVLREFSMTTAQMMIVSELSNQGKGLEVDQFPKYYLSHIVGLVNAGILDKYAATHNDYNDHSMKISFSFMPPFDNVYEIFAATDQETKKMFPQYCRDLLYRMFS